MYPVTLALTIHNFLADSVLERKFLRERVFSHLRWFCHRLGLQFHMVDLYHSLPASWLHQETGEDNEEEEEGGGGGDGTDGEEIGQGSSTLSVQESCRKDGSAIMCELELQGVIQLALREIQVSQNMSVGPTFVVGGCVCDIYFLCVYACWCLFFRSDTASTEVWS